MLSSGMISLAAISKSLHIAVNQLEAYLGPIKCATDMCFACDLNYASEERTGTTG